MRMRTLEFSFVLLSVIIIGCQGQNLIGLLQNPPTTVAVPSTLVPGDIRFTVNATVNTFIRFGNHPSTAIDLNHFNFPQKLYSGYRSIETQDPIGEDTIFRLASMSKLIGAAAVMIYEDKGLISLDDEVSKYIPSFVNTTVLLKTIPTAYQLSTIKLAIGSNLAVISLPYLQPNEINKLHKKEVGIQLATPLNDVNLDGIFTIGSFSPSERTVTVALNSISIVSGDFNVSGTLDVLPKLPKRCSDYEYVYVPFNPSNPLQKERVYYTTEPSKPVTIQHLLSHTAGFSYGTPGVTVDLSSLQTAIMLKKNPALVRFSLNPNLNMDAVQWATEISKIPMMYQPGADDEWNYGPQIGIAGAVLLAYERSLSSNPSQVSLYQIQKKMLFDQLNITSAGYFILDSDPDRASKISNLAHVYTNFDTFVYNPPVPTVVSPLFSIAINGQDFILPGLQATLIDGYSYTGGEGDANPLHPIYGAGSPRKLELADAGLYMTTRDLQKITTMLMQNGSYNGQEIITSNTTQKIFKNQIGETFIVHTLAPAGNVKWGFGCAVGDESVSPAPLDKTTAHWSGAFGGSWYIDQSSKTSFVLNSNILPAIGYQPMINDIANVTSRSYLYPAETN